MSSNLTASTIQCISDVNGSMTVSKTVRRGSNPWRYASLRMLTAIFIFYCQKKKKMHPVLFGGLVIMGAQGLCKPLVGVRSSHPPPI